jgi:hypothetical protein
MARTGENRRGLPRLGRSLLENPPFIIELNQKTSVIMSATFLSLYRTQDEFIL